MNMKALHAPAPDMKLDLAKTVMKNVQHVLIDMIDVQKSAKYSAQIFATKLGCQRDLKAGNRIWHRATALTFSVITQS